MGEIAQLALVDGLEKIGRAVNAYLLLPLLPLPLHHQPLHLPLLPLPPLLHLGLIVLFAQLPARSVVELAETGGSQLIVDVFKLSFIIYCSKNMIV